MTWENLADVEETVERHGKKPNLFIENFHKLNVSWCYVKIKNSQ